MDANEYDRLKTTFLQLFPNVPTPLRTQIIAVVENHTFSWFTAKEEISRNGPYAKPILKQLKEMRVI
ncbi:hypothetical protein J4419_01695 [Candidatus Woesearchaeota archaeon]|nr:hypothetical protein [Candidatus Woesearchaeota archaeon]